jgi:hypothetical protein
MSTPSLVMIEKPGSRLAPEAAAGEVDSGSERFRDFEVPGGTADAESGLVHDGDAVWLGTGVWN